MHRRARRGDGDDRPALGRAVVDLLRAHAGLDLSDTLLRADAE